MHLVDMIQKAMVAKESDSREAFLSSMAQFVKNIVEAKVHVVSKVGGIVRKRRHSTAMGLGGRNQRM